MQPFVSKRDRIGFYMGYGGMFLAVICGNAAVGFHDHALFGWAVACAALSVAAIGTMVAGLVVGFQESWRARR